MLAGQQGSLCAVADAEFMEQRRHVVLDGIFGQADAICDFLITQASPNNSKI